VAVGVSRGYSRRCARGGSVVRFLKRAVLFEVGEDGADGDGLFAVGSSMLAMIRSVPPQWTQVLTSMLTKSPGAIWNSRKAGPKGGGQDARSNTRLRRCAQSLPRLDPGSLIGASRWGCGGRQVRAACRRLRSTHWTHKVKGVSSAYWRVIGMVEEMFVKAVEMKQKWVKGINFARWLEQQLG